MSEQRDPHLQALFTENSEPLTDDEFTTLVMQLTRKRRMQYFLAVAMVAAVILVVASQFLQPLQAVALLATEFLNIELIALGDSTVAWFLTPINNLATVLVVLAKGLRMSWKRAQRASFAN